MLDTEGQPAGTSPNTKLQGPGIYQGLGVIMQRDCNNRRVRLRDSECHREFVVSFDDIWAVDSVEWCDPE